ncbi:hypothetical protein DFH09DRAFT_659124 [Mycena vulgaris]|nr:hypothetical protein DFH09DRAFT_659124 [Mycena vulgaris]
MKPAKFKTPTCALCRRRKLRCDGERPCGPCSRTRTPVECMYIAKTVGQLRSELPKGGACITCRQRKRRCDGNFPCSTCIQSSRPDECKYREKSAVKHNPPKPAHQKNHRSSDSASTSSYSSSSRPATPPQFTTHNCGASQLRDEYTDFYDPFDPLLPWSDVSCSLYLPGSTGSSDALLSLPTFLDCLSFAPAALELDGDLFSLRDIFLQHRWQYGLSVTTAKRRALSSGDSSGVSPTLVNVCELLGYLLRTHSHPDVWLSTNCQTTAEAELYLSIRDQLDGVPGLVPDPLLCLQSYMLLAVYCAQKEDLCGAQEFLLKASNMVVHHAATLGLEDAPALDWCPKFDDSYLSPRSVTEEVRAVFSHLIYISFSGSVVLGLESVIDPGLVEMFRRLAAVHCSDTEINFMRAKTILFLSDSQQLVGKWNRWEFGDPAPTAWSTRYWSMIEDIHAHLNFINTALMDVSCIPELRGAQPTLKTCVIMSLAALAELYGLFAPSQPESRRKHREVVADIISITKSFSDTDYQYLEPNLSTCWSIASRKLYDDEPDVGPPEWDRLTTHEGNADWKSIFMENCNRKLRITGPYALQL